MKTILLLISFFPFVGTAQLPSKYIPRNTIALNDSLCIGQTEITNAQYREFVRFVQDSIFSHLLYDSLPYSRAKNFLNAPAKILEQLTVDNRQEYAKTYGLNYDYLQTTDLVDDSMGISILKEMYYPQAARFYQRREVNTRKLVYRNGSGELIPVYPDTLSWSRDYYVKYKPDSLDPHFYLSQPLVNMYFWHPAYDNYPVVGLNMSQILAFLDWYERKLNANAPEKFLHYTVTLPDLNAYTLAMKGCLSQAVSYQIGPEFLKNPVTYDRTPRVASYHIHKAYNDMTSWPFLKEAEQYAMQQWIKVNSTSPTCPPDRQVLNLLGGPAEVCQTPDNSEKMTILGGDYYFGITDPNGLQENTLFYQRELDAKQGYSTVGFRVMVKVMVE